MFGDLAGTISNALSDTLMDGIQAILYATVYKLLYYIAVACCWIVNLLYSMFEVMAGLSKVSYDGNFDYLINIFFSNSTVSKVYWGMALIGMAVGFGVTIAAVIKKLFDTNEKEKRSYSQILTALFKAILIILCMSMIIVMVINATTLLMQQINYVFTNADDLGNEDSISYTDEEFATMARILNTIGNFSLNPSYNNRYNLNKCFNEIRPDLQYLMQQGVFDFHYVTKDTGGNTIATWQSALQKIANSASLNRDLKLDVYYESVSNALLEAMDLLKVNGSFKPLEDYERQYTTSRSSLPMDRFLFLMATMRAAKNDDYNQNPSMTDPLRGAYYHGEKSIYDLDTVNEDFDIGVAAFDYLILMLTCFKMLEMLATVILNCVGRIFNMLLLYLIAPLILGVYPLDDGGKFKQWTTAFVVQSFSVFGTFISMRVLLLFMPLVVDDKLHLFENPIGNVLAKLVIIMGGFEVAEKATSLITGILADNAGWQSITAGDMSGTAKAAVAKGKQAAMTYASGGMNLALGAAGIGAKVGGGAVGLTAMGAGYAAYGVGKGATMLGGKVADKISAWREQKKNAEASGDDKGGGSSGGAGGAGGSGGAGGAGGGGDQLPDSARQSGGLGGGMQGGDGGQLPDSAGQPGGLGGMQGGDGQLPDPAGQPGGLGDGMQGGDGQQDPAKMNMPGDQQGAADQGGDNGDGVGTRPRANAITGRDSARNPGTGVTNRSRSNAVYRRGGNGQGNAQGNGQGNAGNAGGNGGGDDKHKPYTPSAKINQMARAVERHNNAQPVQLGETGNIAERAAAVDRHNGVGVAQGGAGNAQVVDGGGNGGGDNDKYRPYAPSAKINQMARAVERHNNAQPVQLGETGNITERAAAIDRHNGVGVAQGGAGGAGGVEAAPGRARSTTVSAGPAGNAPPQVDNGPVNRVNRAGSMGGPTKRPPNSLRNGNR